MTFCFSKGIIQNVDTQTGKTPKVQVEPKMGPGRSYNSAVMVWSLDEPFGLALRSCLLMSQGAGWWRQGWPGSTSGEGSGWDLSH